ncbi:phosphodiester glycosidase family protein [Streptomyces sp. PA03-6a]|nr:phosphodiester glycosidase family protein [Streptomyces sp. PA03-6a]
MLNRGRLNASRVAGLGAAALILASSTVAAPAGAQTSGAQAETILTLDLLNSGTHDDDTGVPGVTRTTYAYTGTSGPYKVNVVLVDPDKAPLTLKGTYGSGMAAAQTTTSMLQGVSTNLLRRPRAGVNGGFFDIDATDPSAPPYSGDVAGVVIRNGRLLSEAVRGKGDKPVGSALVLQHGRVYITELNTTLTVQPKDGSVPPRQLDGINRFPGRNAHCEGAAEADADETYENGVCTDPSEIVSFTPEYGANTPTTAAKALGNDPDHPNEPGTISLDGGIEVVLDANDTVLARYEPRGGRAVPVGGRILQGIGEGAVWLRANAAVGSQLKVSETLVDTRFGDDIPLSPSLNATAGGDLLVRNTAVEYVQPAGTTDSAVARTAIGTDGYGRMMLVTVDRGSASKGATRLEMANLLRDLGAVDALNMDGGGSTTLVWQNALANTPSDGKERAVADAVFAGPGGYPLQ